MGSSVEEGYTASIFSEKGGGISLQNCDNHSRKNSVQVFTVMEFRSDLRPQEFEQNALVPQQERIM
jgi:hypothetical protein